MKKKRHGQLSLGEYIGGAEDYSRSDGTRMHISASKAMSGAEGLKEALEQSNKQAAVVGDHLQRLLEAAIPAPTDVADLLGQFVTDVVKSPHVDAPDMFDVGRIMDCMTADDEATAHSEDLYLEGRVERRPVRVAPGQS